MRNQCTDSSDLISNENSGYIQRCPHDQDNPYAQINNKLIRDNSISPECRWLLIYLLSNEKGWKILPAQIVKYVAPHWGRDKVYKILNEAIRGGYLKRVASKRGSVNVYQYFLSENGNFKKISELPENQDPENQFPEKPHTKERPIPTIVGIKKEQCKEMSAIADLLTRFFIDSIKKSHPTLKVPPNLTKWAQEMDKLMRLDGRSEDEIRRVIEWLPNDLWFKTYILSPTSLRKHWDRIIATMSLDAEKELIRKNREFALAVHRKYPKETKKFSFDKKFVSNGDKDIPFNLPHETFRSALLHLYGGKERGSSQ